MVVTGAQEPREGVGPPIWDLPSRCGPTAGWTYQSTALGWLCSTTASTARQSEATSSASRCEWRARPARGGEGGRGWGGGVGWGWHRGAGPPGAEPLQFQPGPSPPSPP